MASIFDLAKFVGSIVGIVFIFFIVLTTLNTMPTGYVSLTYTGNHFGSCESSCGGQTLSDGGNCFCDDMCYSKGDCCIDIRDYC